MLDKDVARFVVWVYGEGCKAGHSDTVKGAYTDKPQLDVSDEDVVDELIMRFTEQRRVKC